MFNLLTKKQWMWGFKWSAWKVAVVLFLIAAWSYKSQTTATTLSNISKLATTMQPTMTYYDANQDAAAIIAISWTAGNAACATAGMVKDEELFNWPGTKKSSGQSATDAKQLNSWRGATFCYTRQAASDTSVTETGVCPDGQVQCDTCNCATGTDATDSTKNKCPVTDFTVTATAPSGAGAAKPCTAGDADIKWPAGGTVKYKAYCKNTAWTSTSSQAPLVDISADTFGPSCISPAAHASGTTYKYLNQVSKGCTTFGTDTWAVLADTWTQSDFFNTDPTNSAAMTSTRLFSAYTSSLGTGSMVLQGRYRVQTLCTPKCRTFRFGDTGTSLIKKYKTNYLSLIWIEKVAFWSSMITLVLAIYVQFSGQRTWRTHESSGRMHLWYVYLMYWCILVTIVSFFLLCQLWIALSPWSFWGSKGYVDYHNRWAKAVKASCITDTNWAKVIKSFYQTTSLATFTWWVQVWTCITALLLTWLLLACYWLHYVLNKRRDYAQVDHNDVELGYQS